MITNNAGALSRRRWLGWGLGACLASSDLSASAAREVSAHNRQPLFGGPARDRPEAGADREQCEDERRHNSRSA